MAQKTKKAMVDISQLNGAQQVAVMRNLSQQAAAWLVGVTGRTLRDRAEVPRNHDGSYDAQQLLEWAKRRLPEPELTDDDEERLLVATDASFWDPGDGAVPLIAFLEDLEARYGDAGLAVFARGLLQQWRDQVSENPNEEPPSRHTFQAEAEKRYEQALHSYAYQRLRQAVICCECRRLRRGRRWVTAKPPAGYAVALSDEPCPHCQARGVE